MAGLGGWELVIVLAIVLLVFGVGRVSKLGSELGRGVSAFREGLREGQEGGQATEDEESSPLEEQQ